VEYDAESANELTCNIVTALSADRSRERGQLLLLLLLLLLLVVVILVVV
jgi:predicted nucleic acid-binding Zn ribbon protein